MELSILCFCETCDVTCHRRFRWGAPTQIYTPSWHVSTPSMTSGFNFISIFGLGSEENSKGCSSTGTADFIAIIKQRRVWFALFGLASPPENGSITYIMDCGDCGPLLVIGGQPTCCPKGTLEAYTSCNVYYIGGTEFPWFQSPQVPAVVPVVAVAFTRLYVGHG